MKRANWLLIIIFVLLMTGCNGYTRYYEDKEIMVVGVQLTEKTGYKYIYTIQIMISDNINSPKNNKSYMYSNKHYSVGDVIWIGARWGKKVGRYGMDLDN